MDEMDALFVCSISFIAGAIFVGGLVFIEASDGEICWGTERFVRVPSMEIETGNERLWLIAKSWEDCWLAIGVDDNRLHWKCDGFASPIRNLVCEGRVGQ